MRVAADLLESLSRLVHFLVILAVTHGLLVIVVLVLINVAVKDLSSIVWPDGKVLSHSDLLLLLLLLLHFIVAWSGVVHGVQLEEASTTASTSVTLAIVCTIITRLELLLGSSLNRG